MKKHTELEPANKAVTNKHLKKAKKIKAAIFASLSIAIIGVLAIIIGGLLFARNSDEPNEANRQSLVEVLGSSIAAPKSATIDSKLGFSVTYDSSQVDVTAQVTDPNSDGNYVFGETYANEEANSSRNYSIVKFNLKQPESSKDEENQDTEVLLNFGRPELSIVTNIRKNYWDDKVSNPAYQGFSKLDIAVSEETTKTLKDNSYTILSQEDLTINGTLYKKTVYEANKSSYGIDTKYQQVNYTTVQNDRAYYINIYFADSTTGELKIFESIISNIKYKPLEEGSLSFNIKDILANLDNEENNTNIANIVSDSLNKVKDLQDEAPKNIAQLLSDSLAGYSDEERDSSEFTDIAGLTTEDLSESETNTPYSLRPETIVDVILKNQLSVVRIATLYCADIDLLNYQGSTELSLKGACTGGIGSGSIISSDGYIATNGHVVSLAKSGPIIGYITLAKDQQIAKDRIISIVNYLKKIGIIRQGADAERLANAALSGDPEATSVIYKIPDIIPASLMKITKEKEEFAVQTSNEPIKANSNLDSFNYEGSVVSAKLVAKNFTSDLSSASTINFLTQDSSDVAILKMEGKFPFVELGNIDDVSKGDVLTAIGFPGFTDGGIFTTQSKTPPTATQGTAIDIVTKQVNNQKLLMTNTPIAQGNSGGPLFDLSGKQVGLNTYGVIECPDTNCFGEGVAIDIYELNQLLAANSIDLEKKDEINAVWQGALNDYENGKYAAAVSGFKKSQDIYPANYLANSLIELAEANKGSGLPIVSISIIITAISASISIWLFLYYRSHKKKAPVMGQPYIGQSLNYPSAAVLPTIPGYGTTNNPPASNPVNYNQPQPVHQLQNNVRYSNNGTAASAIVQPTQTSASPSPVAPGTQFSPSPPTDSQYSTNEGNSISPTNVNP